MGEWGEFGVGLFQAAEYLTQSAGEQYAIRIQFEAWLPLYSVFWLSDSALSDRSWLTAAPRQRQVHAQKRLMTLVSKMAAPLSSSGLSELWTGGPSLGLNVHWVHAASAVTLLFLLIGTADEIRSDLNIIDSFLLKVCASENCCLPSVWNNLLHLHSWWANPYKVLGKSSTNSSIVPTH